MLLRSSCLLCLLPLILSCRQPNSSLLLFSLFFLSCICFHFFFSSRRRHTRCLSDWSSDVCSSDLVHAECAGESGFLGLEEIEVRHRALHHPSTATSWKSIAGNSSCSSAPNSAIVSSSRSEERRVGKECRVRWSA